MELANLFVRISADISDLQKKMTVAQRAVSNLGESMERAGKRLTVAVTIPLLALGGVSVKAAADLDSLRRGIVAVSGSSEEASRQLERLEIIARLPGLGFAEAVQGSLNLQAVGFSAATAERSIKAFGNAVAITGGGKNELDRVLVQLTQMSSAGRILTADLRPIIQISPMIARALREAFGTINAEEIEKLGLSFDEFYERLVTQLESLPQATGGAKNSFENLSDAMFQAAAAIGEQLLPVIAPLVEGLASMAGKIRSLNPETVKWGIALAGVAAAAGPLLVLSGVVTQLAAAISTLLALKTAATIAAMTTGVGAAVVALGALAAVFVKNKLDALEAAGAAEEYNRKLAELSETSARYRFQEVQAALAAKRAELEATPATVGIATGSLLNGGRAQIVNPERVRIEGEIEALEEQFRILTRRLTDIRNEGDAAINDGLIVPIASATSAAEELAKKLDEAFSKVREGAPRVEAGLLGRMQQARADREAYDAARRARFEGYGGTLDYVTPGRAPPSGIVPDAAPMSILDRIGSALEDGIGGALDGVKSAGLSLLNVFNPLAIVGAILSSAFEKVAPALEGLTPIVDIVATILGKALVPILEGLFPIFKMVTIAATYLGQILFNVAGGIAKAIGWAVEAIGKLIDKLPFVSGGPIIRAGQALQAAGTGFIEAASALGEARDEIRDIEWSDAAEEGAAGAGGLVAGADRVRLGVGLTEIQGSRLLALQSTQVFYLSQIAAALGAGGVAPMAVAPGLGLAAGNISMDIDVDFSGLVVPGGAAGLEGAAAGAGAALGRAAGKELEAALRGRGASGATTRVRMKVSGVEV